MSASRLRCLLPRARAGGNRGELQDYKAARQYAQELLRLQPTNRQGLELLRAVEAHVASEGRLGLAIAGTLAAGAVAVGFLLARLRR